MNHSLTERILDLLGKDSGLTDREITNAIHDASAPQQPINQTCRSLERKGIISRHKRHDGLIGNYLIENNVKTEQTLEKQSSS